MRHYGLQSYLFYISDIFFLAYLQDGVMLTRIGELAIEAAEVVVFNSK